MHKLFIIGLLALGWLRSSAEPVVTAGVLDARLKATPLAGRGAGFINAGAASGIDPRLLVAISGAESSYGKAICAANNAWNWFYRGACPPKPGKSSFDTWEDGMHRVSGGLQRLYLSHGYRTIEQIAGKYCAAGCGNWIPNVKSIYTSLNGDLADLTYPRTSGPAMPTTSSSAAHPQAGSSRASKENKPVAAADKGADTEPNSAVHQSFFELHRTTFYVAIGAGILLIAGLLAGGFLLRRHRGVLPGKNGQLALTVDPSALSPNVATVLTFGLTLPLRADERADVTMLRLNDGGKQPDVIGSSAMPQGTGQLEMKASVTPEHAGIVSFQALVQVHRGTAVQTMATATCIVPVLPGDLIFQMPSGWSVSNSVNDSEAIICLHKGNFNGLPTDARDAELIIGKRPMPAVPILDAVRQELRAASKTTVETTLAGPKITYNVVNEKLEYCVTRLYMPHEAELYYVSVQRRTKSSAERDILSAFESVADSIRFSENRSTQLVETHQANLAS